MLAFVISVAKENQKNQVMEETEIVFAPLKKHFKGDGTPKSQIVLHHTVGGDKPTPVVEYWNRCASGRVGTHFVIGKNGEIVQTMDLQNWASHINCDGK
ncbi:MAG: N-acetylmuramoyl-L-alanine amidase, partial [Bacteroidia bacterium]|nr:N-acetylmuramoyl-L-alanine amidase [Bacteroidia bacterium]